jgi:Na+/alanine symporter
MKYLLIALIIWMLPTVLGTQLVKEYKLRHDVADFTLLFIPVINWIVLIVLSAEALEIYTSEQG